MLLSNVILFSKRACTPCMQLKRYIVGETELEYTEYDIEASPEKVEEYGIMSVPVLLLVDDNGKEIARSTGFNPPQVQEIIKQLDN